MIAIKLSDMKFKCKETKVCPQQEKGLCVNPLPCPSKERIEDEMQVVQ